MPTIVVIEPDPDAGEILRALLGYAGFGVKLTSDPSAGISAAIESQPAAILTELFIRTDTGWAVLEYLKTDPLTSMIPVLVITYHSLPDDEDRASRSGAARFLVKPVSGTQVLAELMEVIGRGGGQSMPHARRRRNLEGNTSFGIR